MAIGRQLTPKCLILLFLIGCAPLEKESAQQRDNVDPLYEGLNGGALQSARDALQSALESLRSRATYKWQDSAGSGGSVTPTRTFRIATGHFCREYTEVVSSPAGLISTSRVACRDADGIWKVARR